MAVVWSRVGGMEKTVKREGAIRRCASNTAAQFIRSLLPRKILPRCAAHSYRTARLRFWRRRIPEDGERRNSRCRFAIQSLRSENHDSRNHGTDSDREDVFRRPVLHARRTTHPYSRNSRYEHRPDRSQRDRRRMSILLPGPIDGKFVRHRRSCCTRTYRDAGRHNPHGHRGRPADSPA